MSDPKFTPAPWSIGPARTVVARGHSKLIHVCRVHSTDIGHATADANLHLIAEAPALYLALSDVLEDLHVYEFKTGKGREVVSEERFDAARVVLAHARGEAA